MQEKARALAVVQVQEFMHRHNLTLTDLIEFGGAELKSSDPKTREKARRVDKCWELLAQLSVRYAHLEAAPAHTPTKPARRRRGEGVFLQATENTDVSDISGAPPKSNEINELADFAPVASPEIKSGATS
jgi:hypothetical protein